MKIFIGVVTLFGVIDGQTCNLPLGMTTELISDNQLTASSAFDWESTGPKSSRLGKEIGGGAWCPANQIGPSSHEYIQLDFGKNMRVTSLGIQGRHDNGRGNEFAEFILIEYWRDELSRWSRYRNALGEEIISANNDTETIVRKIFDRGIVSRLFRIIPISERLRTVCLRFEVFGCSNDVEKYGGDVGDEPFRDYGYDGILSGQTHSKGLGILTDGIVGEFEKPHWVGFHQRGASFEFRFPQPRLLNSIWIHCVNSNATFSGFPSKVEIRLDSTQSFDVEDLTSERLRWIRLDFAETITQTVNIRLEKSLKTEWIILSEIRFGYETKENCGRDKATNFVYFALIGMFVFISIVCLFVLYSLICFPKKHSMKQMEKKEMANRYVTPPLRRSVSISSTEYAEPIIIEKSPLVEKTKGHKDELFFATKRRVDVSLLLDSHFFLFPGFASVSSALPDSLRSRRYREDALLSIGTQIAAAVTYLADKQIVWREICANSFHISSDNIVKLTDSTMSKVEMIRWTAWEALFCGQFSTASDVWSLGITLWEVMNECLQIPFEELSDAEFRQNLESVRISDRLNLKAPIHFPFLHSQLFQFCWKYEAAHRISATDLHRQMQNCIRSFSIDT